MKKKIVSASAILLALAFLSSSAYSWNFATHAYIANKIGKILPLGNYNEMYGAMAPDLFNFEFSLMADPTLYAMVRGFTHGIPGTVPEKNNENFLSVWYQANWGLKKAAAFGYVSHNDVWGADFVAHWQANPFVTQGNIPFPADKPLGFTMQPPGYVILLSVQLDLALNFQGVWRAMGLQDDYDTRLMFCHNIIEYAGDLIVKRADPLIGKKVLLAAALRTPEFANLLKAAFPLVCTPMIDAAEPKYREFIMQYGLILLLPEETAIAIMADQLADLAIDYFDFLHPEAPPGSFDSWKPQLVEFGKAAITGAVEICVIANYMDEINLLAIPFVKGQMVAHGVLYW